MPIRKISDGVRYKYFLAYATNLLWLNPNLNFNQLVGKLKNVNQIVCQNPIDLKQLIKIANAVIKQLEEKKLQPIEFNKKRKIVFSPDCDLDKEGKRGIVLHEIAKHSTEKSKEKLYSIIESWDFSRFEKITQSAIIKNHPITKKTVEKYWSEFKHYVKELNDNHNMKPITKKIYTLPEPITAKPLQLETKPVEPTIEVGTVIEPITEYTTAKGFNHSNYLISINSASETSKPFAILSR